MRSGCSSSLPAGRVVCLTKNGKEYDYTVPAVQGTAYVNKLFTIERDIKQVVIGRKNWLFAVVPSGAQASALIYTMVEMALANGVNVYQYLTYLLEKCPTSQTSDEDLEKLAPWDPEVKRITGERSKAIPTA